MRTIKFFSAGLILIVVCAVCAGEVAAWVQSGQANTLASVPTKARTSNGEFISWREHLVDDEAIGGATIRGGDGLAMGDLDQDGYLDIVSVYEADTQYDSALAGHIRIAFGTADPDRWVLTTLASGREAAAAEDVSIGDLNGDGYLDVIAACELAHLIYFQNPAVDIRTKRWERVIPPVASNRGSFIRVFFADLDRDGKLEVVSPNKGAQGPRVTQAPTAISWFKIDGPPLEGKSWVEHELIKVRWPINSQPMDLDQDGDLDIIAGSVAETRIIWFENIGERGKALFRERPIRIAGTSLTGDERPANRRNDSDALISGFHMDFLDMSGDGRLDIVTFEFARLVGKSVVWLEQPASPDGVWQLHEIGDYTPDEVVGLVAMDINSDGLPDVMTGGYSGGARDADTDLSPNVAAGRLAWFQNPGDPRKPWTRHDISRRRRGMFDQFIPRDMDGDGDIDFLSTRGNSSIYDGVFWLEQVRTPEPAPSFRQARPLDSPELSLPVVP